jgi:hypothetical protein
VLQEGSSHRALRFRDLMSLLQAKGIFMYQPTEEQMEYMQYMVDPKSDLKYTLDETLLAVS